MKIVISTMVVRSDGVTIEGDLYDAATSLSPRSHIFSGLFQ